MELPRRLTIWARAHHQLVTRTQWHEAGLAERAFDRAAERGVLKRVAPNVALLAGGTLDSCTRIAAWALSLGPGTVASHRSAAFLWGADLVGDQPIDLVARRPSARRTPAGVLVHRPRDAGSLHAIVRRSVPVTSPLRTLVDLGAARPDLVAGALESFAALGLVSPAGIARNAARDRRRGRAGSTALLRAVDELTIDGTLRDSLLESRGSALFARFGIDGWVFHHAVGPYELDFGFPAEKIGVEVDGWSSHGTRAGFEHDRARDAWLASRGWLILRFTWRQVTNRPGIVASRISETRAQRGHRPSAA